MSRNAAILSVFLFVSAFELLLLAFQARFEDATLQWLYSEAGPFERLSEWFWYFAAGCAVVWLRPRGWRPVSVALFCVFGAVREADLSKAFTHDSITKINYYIEPDYPVEERLLAAGVAVMVVGVIVELLIAGVRFALREPILRRPWGAVACAFALLLVGTKVLDRSESLLEKHLGIETSATVGRSIRTLEEGMEMMLPLIVVFAIVLARQERLRPATADRVDTT